MHVSILPQTLLPSRLPHNTEQISLCYTVGPCWLSILNIEVCTYRSQTLLTISFSHSSLLATISLFSKSVNTGISCKLFWAKFMHGCEGQQICLVGILLKLMFRCCCLWVFIYRSFPGGSDGKESACNTGVLDLIPGLGGSPGEGNLSMELDVTGELALD